VPCWQGFLNAIRGLATPKFVYGGGDVMQPIYSSGCSQGFSLRKPQPADLRPAAIYHMRDRECIGPRSLGLKYVSDFAGGLRDSVSAFAQDEN